MLFNDQAEHLCFAHSGGDSSSGGTILAGEHPVFIELSGNVLNGQDGTLGGLALKFSDTSDDVHIC